MCHFPVLGASTKHCTTKMGCCWGGEQPRERKRGSGGMGEGGGGGGGEGKDTDMVMA